MVEKITSAIDQKKVSVGIFIDLKKVFDTINHNILIDKLNLYGIRGVASSWLKSYLCNRQQYVNYQNVNSSYKQVICGIPQGSIIGPTLFILYINDLCNVSKLLKFILFADDTNIFYEDVSVLKLQNTLNNELCKLNNWFMVNRLSLNAKKTSYIIFSNKTVCNNVILTINNEPISKVDVMKFYEYT